MSKKLDWKSRDYFRTFIDCIQHEYDLEKDKPFVEREMITDLLLKNVKASQAGAIINLGKVIPDDQIFEMNLGSRVELKAEENISYTRGTILKVSQSPYEG